MRGRGTWGIEKRAHAWLLLALAGCASAAEQDAVTVEAAVTASTGVSPVPGPLGAPDDQHLLSQVLARADFVGALEVVETEGRFGTMGRAAEEAIWTDVHFSVVSVVKDSAGLESNGGVSLTFLGGRVGSRELRVEHFPSFEPGEQVIVIAKSDEKPCPTYSGEYGVLRIRDGRVFTSFGHPLVRITDDGYDVRTPREMMPNAPEPVAVAGFAGGRAVLPLEGDASDALTVEDALGQLRTLMEHAR